MDEPKNGHLTQEAMITRGEQFSLFEDLDGLSDEALIEIAQLCSLDADPDVCVPCRAFALVLERSEQQAHEDAEQDHQEAMDEFHQEAAEEEAYAYAEDLLAAGPRNFEAFQKPEVPVTDRFAKAVHDLDLLVTELLEGPPIPPPNVTLEELGALVLGSKRWLKMMDAQDLELAPAQEAIRREVERVVEKVTHG